jgi:hypothetical protein
VAAADSVADSQAYLLFYQKKGVSRSVHQWWR